MNDLEKIRDAHLDNLIRLAFMYQDALEAEGIIRESDRELTLEERNRRAAVYARFQEKLRAENARARRERLIRSGRKHAGRIVQIAACIVLLLGIATPIAIANVDSVRAKVLQLLISIKSDHTELSLVEDEAAAFEVPEGWQGSYFPSYIPEGYHVRDIFPDCSIFYENSNEDWFSFDECTEDTYMNINSEDACLSYETVNGTTAFVVERYDVNIVTWANDEHYFVVMSTESKDLALKIAKSVKKIIE